MTIFKFSTTVPSVPGAFESAAIGTDGTAPNRFTSNDINKAVKLGPLDNYVPVASGDELEGVVASIEGHNVNSGFSFGTVQRKFNNLEANQTGATTVVVGDLIVCDAQAALNTVQTAVNVKKGTPTKFIWRVKSLLGGGGLQNTPILIERING